VRKRKLTEKKKTGVSSKKREGGEQKSLKEPKKKKPTLKTFLGLGERGPVTKKGEIQVQKQQPQKKEGGVKKNEGYELGEVRFFWGRAESNVLDGRRRRARGR